jgi:hypothetical protein
VEAEIVRGRPWSAIINDTFPDIGLTPDNVKQHVARGHLLLTQVAADRAELRDVSDQVAREILIERGPKPVDPPL